MADDLPHQEETPSTVGAPADARPTKPDEAKHIREWGLAAIAVASIVLNVYLATRQATVERIAQPGPHIGRLMMTGLAARTLNEVVRRSPDVLTNSLGRVGFVATEEWTTLLTADLPAVALNNQELRFLSIENLTDNLYESVSISVGTEVLASLGAVRPHTTALVFYSNEAALTGAQVNYTVAGTIDVRTEDIQALAGDAIELLTGDLGVGTTVRLLSTIPASNDPLRSLLNILDQTRQ